MALVLTEKSLHYQSWIWKVEESIDWFLGRVPISEDKKTWISNWNHNRKLEWLASRFLLLEYAKIDDDQIQISLEGKPSIADSPIHFSISHSGDYVAIVTAPHPIGIDIQVFRKDIERIAPKFISEDDLSIWPITYDRAKSIHHVWTIKEALFKAYGLGRLDFKAHIQILPASKIGPEYVLKGTVKNERVDQEYQVSTRLINQLYLSIALQKSLNSGKV